MANFKQAEIFFEKDAVRIEIPNSEPIRILYQWLRDHCRCMKCYNETTHQRKLSVLDFPENIIPEKHDLSNGVLNLIWDGGHGSRYELSWLLKNATFIGDDKKQTINIIPWLKLPEIQKVSLKSYMNTDDGLAQVLSSLIRYGVAIVTDVEPTLSATEKVITRMSPVQKTLFGEMWEIIHDDAGRTEEIDTLVNNGETITHKDTAYTNIALGAHTDNTYWCDAAGLEVFHFLKPAPRGGETLLVDGLSVSLRLKREHPEAYERLTRVPVAATYAEEGQYHTHVDPILKLDPVTKEFLQIRFNLYDRSVLRTVPYSEMKQHYSDLRLIASIIADEKGENYFKFPPGEVIFIDNWRVMHGRAAYSGLRHMGGSYVARTDWRSRAAVLGLVDNM